MKNRINPRGQAKEKKSFPKIVQDVVSQSDIVLEILDARFLGETRNRELEAIVEKSGKRLIVVVNKSDLVDSPDVSSFRDKKIVLVSVNTKKGIDILRKRIKIEASKIKKERVYVGVVGFPNVGKSSLINVLTRRAAARISETAGQTRGVQKIKLSGNILLLDTPGVFEQDREKTWKERMLEKVRLNAKTKVKDPGEAVYYLFEMHSDLLSRFYGVDAKDYDEFIERVARKKGFLLKGDNVDENRVANTVLKDWQKGKIKLN